MCWITVIILLLMKTETVMLGVAIYILFSSKLPRGEGCLIKVII